MSNHANEITLKVRISPGDGHVVLDDNPLIADDIPEVTKAIANGMASPGVLKSIAQQLGAQRLTFEVLGLTQDQADKGGEKFQERELANRKNDVLNGRASFRVCDKARVHVSLPFSLLLTS